MASRNMRNSRPESSSLWPVVSYHDMNCSKALYGPSVFLSILLLFKPIGACIQALGGKKIHHYGLLHASRSRLCDPLHRTLQPLRFLDDCSECYRVERTSSRVGVSPTVDRRLARRAKNLV
jgi:hypothetical protein